MRAADPRYMTHGDDCHRGDVVIQSALREEERKRRRDPRVSSEAWQQDDDDGLLFFQKQTEPGSISDRASAGAVRWLIAGESAAAAVQVRASDGLGAAAGSTAGCLLQETGEEKA